MASKIWSVFKSSNENTEDVVYDNDRPDFYIKKNIIFNNSVKMPKFLNFASGWFKIFHVRRKLMILTRRDIIFNTWGVQNYNHLRTRPWNSDLQDCTESPQYKKTENSPRFVLGSWTSLNPLKKEDSAHQVVLQLISQKLPTSFFSARPSKISGWSIRLKARAVKYTSYHRKDRCLSRQ